MRRVLRVAVAVMVVVCVVFFFSISGGASGGGSGATGTRQESWMTIGEPWPWYESRLEQEIRPDGGQSGSSKSGVILKSPAWVLPVVALAGLVVFRRLRPPSPAVAPA
jgi:hypothetical protein